MEILIVEDNPHDYLLLETYLLRNGFSKTSLYHVTSLANIQVDIYKDLIAIFLDLYLPDSTGMDTFREVMRLFPSAPIIVLSGEADTEVALRAIQSGAQDYLIKGEFNEKMILKSLNYSRERKRIQESVRASNERYEMLARVTGEAIWEMDIAQGRVSCGNAVYETVFGYHETADMPWRWWYTKIHAADRLVLRNKLREYHTTLKPSLSLECRMRSASGHFRYVLLKMYFVYEQGRLARMVGSVQDIDEIKLMQRQLSLRQSQHQREIIRNTIQIEEREKRKLGRELHDNINQILASCRMCIDTAMKYKDQSGEVLPIAYRNLGLALDEIKRLSRDLVSPFLGGCSFKEAIENLIFPLTTGNRLRFRMKIDDIDEPDEIKVMLYRIIQEQLHNIMKYAKASIVVIRVEKRKNDIKVEIADNGVGFDPELKAEGIGLKNIRYRAEHHKGIFSIQSGPDQGCKLSISIPLTGSRLKMS